MAKENDPFTKTQKIRIANNLHQAGMKLHETIIAVKDAYAQFEEPESFNMDLIFQTSKQLTKLLEELVRINGRSPETPS